MTSRDILQNSYTGIYLERSGVNAVNMVEVLLDEPEMPLTDEEKAEVYQYETSLFTHDLGNNVSVSEAIRAQADEETIAPFFFADAFIKGAITLPDGEQGSVVPSFEAAQDVYVWLATSIKTGALSRESLVTMAEASAEHYMNSLTDSLANELPIADTAVDRMPLVLQPEKFITMVNNVQKSRQFIVGERQTQTKVEQPIEGAKRAVLDVYLGKINSLVASDVPMSEYLYLQSALINDDEMMDVARESIPSGLRRSVIDESTRPAVLRRLDYIRNGMGYRRESGASSVSEIITSSSPAMFESQVDAESAHFTPQQLEAFKQTMLTPEQQAAFFTRVIDAAGLLEGAPSDGDANDGVRFKVRINKEKTTFMVAPGAKEFRVSSVPRSLYDVIVVGGFHELTHINQALADKQFGNTLKIAGLRGKRIAMLREGGANQKQRQAELQLFGRSKPVASLTYASALKAIEAGGGIKEAAVAFYEAKRTSSPSTAKKAAAAEAADRVLRIVRQGGLNSKAMSYAEEVILHNETEGMSDAVKARATAITCLDLPDQVRLHRYGLLPEIDNTDIDWTPYILEVATPYIDEITSKVK